MSTAKSLYDPPGPGIASYRIIESVEHDLSAMDLNALKSRLKECLQHFPELSETTVTVAKKPEDHSWYAEADWDNDIIFLPTHESCPAMTICHELGHLAIHRLDNRGADAPPTSEEFCSIFSTARMPAGLVDTNHIAYLGHPDVPSAEWPSICRRALEYREDNRDYIQQCKEWLEV